MASILRVKRRIDEDPAEALVGYCKRKKQSEYLNPSGNGENITSIFSFAGTISTKEEPVSRHIKEAIKKTKQHPHTSNFKPPSKVKQLTSELRERKKQTSIANRFRITCSRRALGLDSLDDAENISKQQKKKLEDNRDTEDSAIAKKDEDKTLQIFESSKSSSLGEYLPSCLLNDAEPKHHEHGDNVDELMTNFLFSLIDVEVDAEKIVSDQDPFLSGITVNNQPMVSNKEVSSPPNEKDFVYDLYVANNVSDLEEVCTVKALCEYTLDEELDYQERDGCSDNSDDSNDENNWRNDYPDEDPHFFENEDEDNYYAEDMVDTNFLHCDEEGDQLACWMGTNCNIDGGSDDEENEYEEKEECNN